MNWENKNRKTSIPTDNICSTYKKCIGNNHFLGKTTVTYLHYINIQLFDVTTWEKLVAVPSVQLLQRPISFEVDSISFKKDKSHSHTFYTIYQRQIGRVKQRHFLLYFSCFNNVIEFISIYFGPRDRRDRFYGYEIFASKKYFLGCIVLR